MTEGRFFCEHCGVQVPLTAHECPSCHRLFGDVRCPRCQHSDVPGAFRNGCPECGYMAKNATTRRHRPSSFVPVMTILGVLLVLGVFLVWMVKG